MSIEIRESRIEDAEASRQLSFEAFGMPEKISTTPAPPLGAGVRQVAAFDGQTMVGKLNDRDFACWFGGKLVPNSGIGGVTVALEYRGQGLMAPMFESLFSIARERGAVISTLFPSSIGIYRRFGYEVIGTRDLVRLPMDALGRGGMPNGVTVRRATLADIPEIERLYDGWAQGGNGPLSRRTASATPTEEVFAQLTAVTVAVEGGVVIGYAYWDRGSQPGVGGTIEIRELIADRAAGYQALATAIGSFAGTAGSVTLMTSGLDIYRNILASSAWQIESATPYMLKILDVVGAIEARGYSSAIVASVEFQVRSSKCSDIDGRYVLDLADGHARCHRIGDFDSSLSGLPVFTPQGLAIAYAGAQSCAGIRAMDGLSGPADCDETFGAIFGGRPVRIRDRF